MQKARTQQSARAFLQGLCNPEQQGSGQKSTPNLQMSCNASSWRLHVQPKQHDPVLRFFDMCPAFDDYVAEVRHQFLVGHLTRAPFAVSLHPSSAVRKPDRSH